MAKDDTPICDDAHEWLEFTKGVKPLPRVSTEPRKPVKKTFTQFTLTPPPPPILPVKNPLRRRIKNIHVTSRLDLHGLTQAQAHARLVQFISGCAQTGHRCVLVITGKGQSSNEQWWKEGGVLKKMVPRWLQEEPMRSKISATATAKPEHGGSGALYVYLKA